MIDLLCNIDLHAACYCPGVCINYIGREVSCKVGSMSVVVSVVTFRSKYIDCT